MKSLALEKKIPADLREEVADKLPYASEKLSAFEISADGASIAVACEEEDRSEVEDKVRRLVSKMIGGHRAVEADRMYSHRVAVPNRKAVWEELLGSGLLAEEGPGQVALLGDSARVAEALDRRFVAIAEKLGATPHQYPTMLAMSALDRCHYFSSFPHHVTFAPHVKEDIEAITKVGEEDDGVDRSFLEHLAPPAHVLSPAVCFHTYRLLADRALESPLTVTAKGRCFRFESKNLATLERSWDFSMREVIFVGPKEWVAGRRQRVIEETTAFVEELDLDAWIESANDHFFATNFVAKRYHQMMTQAKYELRLALPYAGADKSLAAASFNVHGDFFGRSFAIAHAGAFASTGCVGFGIERWVWSLYAQLGASIASWPARVRAALSL